MIRCPEQLVIHVSIMVLMMFGVMNVLSLLVMVAVVILGIHLAATVNIIHMNMIQTVQEEYCMD